MIFVLTSAHAFGKLLAAYSLDQIDGKLVWLRANTVEQDTRAAIGHLGLVTFCVQIAERATGSQSARLLRQVTGHLFIARN